MPTHCFSYDAGLPEYIQETMNSPGPPRPGGTDGDAPCIPCAPLFSNTDTFLCPSRPPTPPCDPTLFHRVRRRASTPGHVCPAHRIPGPGCLTWWRDSEACPGSLQQKTAAQMWCCASVRRPQGVRPSRMFNISRPPVKIFQHIENLAISICSMLF